MEVETNGFLDGRLQILQPVAGYRAAIDPILLAAFVQAKSGQSVLDVGCGVGVALLAVGVRISDLMLYGLERDEATGELAQENGVQNKISAQIFTADLADLPPVLKQQTFDHVITNPPFHKAFHKNKNSAPQQSHKHSAHQESMALCDWITACLRRVKPRGYFYMIHHAGRLPDILTSLTACGDITILPIAPRLGRDANRVLIRARKGAKGAGRLCPPLVIHQECKHKTDGEDYSDTALAILRHCAGLKDVLKDL